MAFPAAAIIVAFAVLVILYPEGMKGGVDWITAGIVTTFGWYYVILVAAFVVFALWVGIGHFGDIKLGKDNEKPEFGLMSWFAMLFAAGMGIGLVFYGVAEPMQHYFGVPNAFADDPTRGPLQGDAEGSLIQTYLHWGLQPWAIYVVVGLAIAYTVYRKGRPVSIRWALEPLLGRRVHGWLGDAIDIAAVLGTLFGVAASLGFGTLQIAEGLNLSGVGIDVENPGLPHVLIIGGITLIAVISVATGVEKGIKWLSNINMVTAALVLVYVAIAGGVGLFLLRDYIESIGLYLQNLVQMSFDVSAFGGDAGLEWQQWWTVFYWGWWISWAPFVGIFIARISRGRTVREFVAGVLAVPTLVSFLWFTVFGGSALFKQVEGDANLKGSAENAEGLLFEFLHGLPLGTVLGWIAILLIVVFFVTSSDSGSFVVDMLASGGDPNPPRWSRIFWAILEGVTAAAVLLAGGHGAIRGVAIAIALPFSFVMILLAIATWKQFHSERQAWLAVQRRHQHEEITENVTTTLIEEGLIPEPDNGGLPSAQSGSRGPDSDT